MKISYNPENNSALTQATVSANYSDDIIFDLASLSIWAKGKLFTSGGAYSIFKKASETGGGENGLVPAPDYNNDSKTRYLSEDGTWKNIPDSLKILINDVDFEESTINFKQGNYITLTPNGENVTIEGNYKLATQEASGLMSAADKEKLDNISFSGGEGEWSGELTDSFTTIVVNNEVTLKASNNKTINLIGENITADTNTNTILVVTPEVLIMEGATATTDGESGLVPAPTKDDYLSFLRGDGNWVFLNEAGIIQKTYANTGGSIVYKKVVIEDDVNDGHGIIIFGRNQTYLLTSEFTVGSTVLGNFWELGTNYNEVAESTSTRNLHIKCVKTTSSDVVTLYIAVDAYTYFQIWTSGTITISDSSVTEWNGITSSTTGWKAVTYANWNNTTYSIVSSTANGLAPKLVNTNTNLIDDGYYILASSNGTTTPSWYKLPDTAFTEDDHTVSMSSTNNKIYLLGSEEAPGAEQNITTHAHENLWYQSNTLYSDAFNGELYGSLNTGVVAVTLTEGDNSTKVATTAFVKRAIDTFSDSITEINSTTITTYANLTFDGIKNFINTNTNATTNDFNNLANTSSALGFGKDNSKVLITTQAGKTDGSIFIRQYYTSWGDWYRLCHSGNTYLKDTIDEKFNTAKTSWESYVDAKTEEVYNLIVADAPEAYDTLKEIVDYLKDNSDATSYIEGKVNRSGDTMTGTLSVPNLIISDTNAVKHIEFKRASYNYITAPTGGLIHIVPNGQSVSNNAGMIFHSTGFIPGETNKYNLGSSTKYWKNLYVNTLNLGGTNQQVVLGDGTSKNISDFVLESELGETTLISNLQEFNKVITVGQDWTDTGISGEDLESGTYAVLVYCNNENNSMLNAYYSGIMSWYSGSTNDNEGDEIVLHSSSLFLGNRIYLRTLQTSSVNKILIASNKALEEDTYTFKFKRII